MSLYNVVFTALTPLIVGTMDSDVNREMSRKYPGPRPTAPPPHKHLQCLFACSSSLLLSLVWNIKIAVTVIMSTSIIVHLADALHCLSAP